jgi:acyl-CoA synthetase (AMP-forming)/AMP-acid ligase II
MAPKIYRSVKADLDLPRVDLIQDIFTHPYHVSKSQAALIEAETGKTHTYADVLQRVRSLAHGLRGLRVSKDEVVAFFSPNSIDYPVICFAVVGCGALIAPISAALTAAELREQLQTSRAKYLVVDSALMSTARTAVEGMSLKWVMQADGMSSVNGVATANMLATNSPQGSLYQADPSEVATRPAFLCFSSGTTGRAKGTMITHHNLTSNLRQNYAHKDNAPYAGKVQVAFLPLNHIYGLAVSCTQCKAVVAGDCTDPRV